MSRFYKAAVSFVVLITLSFPGFSVNSYPLIHNLNQSDVLFQQLSGDINKFYMARESGEAIPPLLIFRYVMKNSDSLFTVAARLNVPIETIITLNRLERAEDALAGRELLLPNIPGLFVSENPKTDLEYIISSWRRKGKDSLELSINKDGTGEFYFLPGETFHSVERSFFFGVMFRFPLPKGKITSRYGPRLQPFTGKPEFHRGLDIAAPEGTGVLAARGGTVEETGTDDICGNYIVLLHESNFETKYCHLKKIFVSLHQKVRSGIIIGEVGATGMATGPHLHFEIRERGQSKDPLMMIQGKQP